jgi:hypothetical protein
MPAAVDPDGSAADIDGRVAEVFRVLTQRTAVSCRDWRIDR